MALIPSKNVVEPVVSISRDIGIPEDPFRVRCRGIKVLPGSTSYTTFSLWVCESIA